MFGGISLNFLYLENFNIKLIHTMFDNMPNIRHNNRKGLSYQRQMEEKYRQMGYAVRKPNKNPTGYDFIAEK